MSADAVSGSEPWRIAVRLMSSGTNAIRSEKIRDSARSCSKIGRVSEVSSNPVCEDFDG